MVLFEFFAFCLRFNFLNTNSFDTSIIRWIFTPKIMKNFDEIIEELNKDQKLFYNFKKGEIHLSDTAPTSIKCPYEFTNDNKIEFYLNK